MSDLHQLKTTLADIAGNIVIQADFCIIHPDYPPLTVAAEVANSFHQQSINIQNNYLSLRLQNFLYNVYFSGKYKTTAATAISLEEQPLENNLVGGLNIDFYDKLESCNCSQGYFDPGWQFIRQESDDAVAVRKNNLTIHIVQERHLQMVKTVFTPGELLAIRLPHNLLDSGCYVAVGNAGKVSSSTSSINIYFNVNAAGALVLLQEITQQLNEINIPFAFKLPYDPDDFDCYDACTLHCDRNNYSAVQEILTQIYSAYHVCFRPPVPLFSKSLAPGISVAEVPTNQPWIEKNYDFGNQRCRMVADGLLLAWNQGDNSFANRMASIEQQFRQYQVSLEQPYLNTGAEDIYKLISWNGAVSNEI